jgi:Ca-activated chloride channel family protein
MKLTVAALAALLLLSNIACHEPGSTVSFSNQKIATPRKNTSSDSQSSTPESKASTENFTPPVIMKDEEITPPPANSSDNEKAVRGTAVPEADKKSIANVNSPSDYNTEEYSTIVENNFLSPLQSPLSTFSIDVDEAAYSNIRRYLQNGSIPPAGAVRIEEMINYFDYDYPQPINDDPFAVISETSECPWNPQHKLVHIGLQGKLVPTENLPASNLVFLIDVSGSMDEPNKLPLVKASLKMLVDQLREKDKVAIAVYAGSAGLVLPSTNGTSKQRIKEAIDNLEAGGSTAGGEGIQLAYRVANANFNQGGNNRIILATDGDFNVGISSDDELVRLVEKERGSGVFLSILGFGMENYKDSKMQQLADKGNGNHSYIDNINEARKVLVNEFGSTLFTIAKDVKIQVEFNPARVQSYRLVGYENRLLASEDFNDDTKDAGELGSGHTVTALYEIIPAGVKDEFTRRVDSLKYQRNQNVLTPGPEDEIMTIKLRYKKPAEETSRLIVQAIRDNKLSLANSSDNFRFSAAVAEFGLLLRSSAFRQQSSYQQVVNLAKGARGKDVNGYRAEFVRLVQAATSLAKN